MFIAIQFPFTDARPFLNADTCRLTLPIWSLPTPNIDFVRSFGVIKRRLLGGINNWSNEEMYCRVTNAIKFKSALSTNQTLVEQKIKSNQVCEFRRLIADGRFQAEGNTVIRLEVGFSYGGKVDIHAHNPPEIGGNGNSIYCADLNYREFVNFLQIVLGQSIVIRRDGKAQPGYLSDAGDYVEKKYLDATTKQLSALPIVVESWWFRRGSPLAVLEYESGLDITEFPPYLKTIQSEILSTAKIEVGYMEVEFRGKRFGVWLLGVKRKETDREVLRGLRLNLFRFHAELESIKQIFRLIVRKNITVERGSLASDRLQRFLNDSIRLLSKETRDGIPPSAFLDIAQQGEDIITPGERTTLLTQLSDVRGNLLKNIEKFTEQKEKEDIKVIVTQTFNAADYRSNMNNQTLNNFGTMGDVNQVAAQSIDNSFNKIAQSEASQELKAKFEELNAQVAELLKSLPKDKQDKVARDLETLTEETASKEPRKPWLELSAQGLIDAAKTVGEIAAPVITTVKAILALIG